MNMKQALLVIDVQNEYFTGAMPVTYPEKSFDYIKKAILTAKKKQIPVIFIQHTTPRADTKTFKAGTYEHEIHPELLSIGGDVTFEKNFASSLYKTGLKEYLEENQIDTVTICGYMTQMCCDTTARHAAHLGYKVNFLSDATGTLDFKNEQGSITAKQLHEAILITQAKFFSNVMTTDDWCKEL